MPSGGVVDSTSQEELQDISLIHVHSQCIIIADVQLCGAPADDVQSPYIVFLWIILLYMLLTCINN